MAADAVVEASVITDAVMAAAAATELNIAVLADIACVSSGVSESSQSESSNVTDCGVSQREEQVTVQQSDKAAVGVVHCVVLQSPSRSRRRTLTIESQLTVSDTGAAAAAAAGADDAMDCVADTPAPAAVAMAALMDAADMEMATAGPAESNSGALTPHAASRTHAGDAEVVTPPLAKTLFDEMLSGQQLEQQPESNATEIVDAMDTSQTAAALQPPQASLLNAQ